MSVSSRYYRKASLLCRFSITLTTPLDDSNTESEQELGMYLIAVALETAGVQLARCSVLLSLVENQLCRAIIAQLSDTNTSGRLLAASLRLVHVLVRHLRVHLKLQVELFMHVRFALFVVVRTKLDYCSICYE